MNNAAETMDAVDNILAQWQSEIPELEAEPMVLIGRVRRCSALLTPKLEQVFNQYGLGSGAFDVLATLRRAGHPYCLTPTELFSSLMVTSGTMTTRLKNLETQGWIERLPNPQDARSLLVQLTPAGKKMIEEAVFPHVANEKQILAALPLEVRTRLEADLKVLMRVLEAKDGRE